MSNYRRPHATGARIYFTVALARGGEDLLVREIKSLRAAVVQTRNERPFGIDAWVVLPDQMHAIWTMPPGDGDFSTRWGAIKARFTRAVKSGGRVGFDPTVTADGSAAVGWNPTLHRSRSKVSKGDAGIWQRRFWEHHIRDESDYDAHMLKCWLSPVASGLAARAEDWPYSSIHRDIRMGLVAPDKLPRLTPRPEAAASPQLAHS